MNRADVLLHPVRLRIVQALAAAGEATVARLAEQLDDVAVPSLYRHLRKLIDADLLEVAKERPVRGAIERTYRLSGQAARLGADDIAEAPLEDHLRWFLAFLLEQYRAFAVALQNDGLDLAGQGIGYHMESLWLSDEELAALSTELRALLDRYADNPRSGARRPRRWTTLLMPEPMNRVSTDPPE